MDVTTAIAAVETNAAIVTANTREMIALCEGMSVTRLTRRHRRLS